MQRQEDMEGLAVLDLEVLGDILKSSLYLHTKPLHIENETASPATCNIKDFLWEAVLGLELLRKNYWSYMIDLQKTKYFL